MAKIKNSDFIKKVVRCKDCIHRRTDNCPMLEDYYNVSYQEWEQVDETEDEGFCHLGERDEEAEEADIRHNEYNNFLTSIMSDVYHNLNG